MNLNERAREIRLKIAKGIFEDKWSSDEVEQKEHEILLEALTLTRREAMEEAAHIVDSFKDFHVVKPTCWNTLFGVAKKIRAKISEEKGS